MDEATSSTRKRLLLSGLSTVVALGLAYAFYPRGSGDEGTTEIVDDSETVGSLLTSRVGTVAEAGSLLRHFPDSTLLRERISEADARALFPALQSEEGKRHVYDPDTYFRYNDDMTYRAGFSEHPDGRFLVDTNLIGLLRDDEVSETPPDLRVLVAGDSHTAGACNNDEAFALVLERLLEAAHPGDSIEVLNAGVGYYTFYQYLGVLERYLDLDPDVFVVAAYGGNDFFEMIRILRYFQRTERKMPSRTFWDRMTSFEKACPKPKVWIGQAVSQLMYFAEFPEEEDEALETIFEVIDEIQRICEAEGIELVFAYIPPMWDVQLERYDPDHPRIRDSLDIGAAGVLGSNDRADRLLAHLKQRGIPAADLRPTFRADPEPLFWFSDHHINLRGHEQVAEGLLPLVEAAYR